MLSGMDDLRAEAERDQLWASLRALRPEIERLATGHRDGGEREDRLISVVAAIVAAELRHRAGEPPAPPAAGE
jgi:hypothetical protein